MPDDVDLEQWMAGDEPDWDSEPIAEPMADQAKANALLRHLRTVETELAERAEPQYQEELARLNAWISRKRGRAKWLREWLREWLADWHRAQYLDHGTATIELPSGDLESTKKTDYEYEDEDAFLSWAQKNAVQLVRHPAPRRNPPPAVDKNAVKKAFPQPKDLVYGDWEPVTEDGEKVPGLKIVVSRTFKAKPNV